jgi:hypothetical protein
MRGQIPHKHRHRRTAQRMMQRNDEGREEQGPTVSVRMGRSEHHTTGEWGHRPSRTNWRRHRRQGTELSIYECLY